MSVIGILNPKGGAGKSTLTTNLACALVRDGFSVLIIDSDPQGTSRDWYAARPDSTPLVVGMDATAIHKGVAEYAGRYDHILIDGAAKIEGKDSVKVVKACDLVLIPVQPSGADVWGAQDLVALIHDLRERFERPAAALVVSRQVQGSKLAADVEEVLRSYELPVLAGRTSQRVAYAEAVTGGLSVFDVDPEGKAAEEIERIEIEMLELLNG